MMCKSIESLGGKLEAGWDFSRHWVKLMVQVMERNFLSGVERILSGQNEPALAHFHKFIEWVYGWGIKQKITESEQFSAD